MQRSTFNPTAVLALAIFILWTPACGDATTSGVQTTPVLDQNNPASAQPVPSTTTPAAAQPVLSPGAQGVTAVNDPTPHVLGPGANAGLLALKVPIEAAARASGVPASLLGALIWQESRADVQVAGGGLAQISDYDFTTAQAAHPDLIQGSVSDADANIMACAFNLLELKDVMQTKFGRSDWPIILRAYNSGRNGVDPNDLAARPAATGDPTYVAKLTLFWQIIVTQEGTLPP